MTLDDIVHDPSVSVPAHTAAAGSVILSIAGWLPNIAALAAIIWYTILIYDWAEKRWWPPKKEPRR